MTSATLRRNKSDKKELSKLFHVSCFVLAGGSAFAANAVVLHVLVQYLWADPYLAQVLGLWSSITVSWWINRTFTFKVLERPSLKEYSLYLVSMTLTSLVNYSAYTACITFSDFLYGQPVLALGVAALVSMCVSYASMRGIVFRRAVKELCPKMDAHGDDRL